jgi:glycosyltransferase involved in cell wall biosynthesis
MHLTLIITRMDTGGMERFAANVCNALRARGNAVRLCSLHRSPAEGGRRWLNPEVPFVELGAPARFAAGKIRRFCREHPDDPVLALGAEIVVLLVLLKSLGLIRNPILYRESTAPGQHYSRCWRWMIRHFVSRADALLLQSRQALVDLETIFPVHQPTLLLRNPCAYLLEPPGREYEACSSGEQAPHVLVVGRMDHMKGHKRLLSAFPALLQAWPDIRLTLVGTGVLEPELKELAGTLGIQKRICFMGFQADPLPFYLDADILILPSDYEGLPNVVPEALACGCRVLTADGEGGIREIMDDLGLSDFVVAREGFERSLARGLEAVQHSNPALWMRARAKLTVLAHPDKVAQQLWEFCEGLVRKPEGPRLTGSPRRKFQKS